MTTKPSSINEAGIYQPFPADTVQWEEFSHGNHLACRYKALSAFGGGSHVGVVLEELPPGKQTNLLHYHMLEEEHVFILDGELTVRLGTASYRMAKGDFVCFPAGQAAGHTLVNHGTEPCRYILIGENNPNEVVVYPETGRVGVRLLKEGYRKSAVMDYWEGAP